MLVLAFDTSTNRGSAAVLRDGAIVSRLSWDREGSHGEMLVPALEESLKKASAEASDLDAIAIGHGPGSFTGVRVAVNAAKALSYANGLPVYAFDTTELLAAGVLDQSLPVLALVNAHKNLVYASTFEWSGRGWVRKLDLDARTVEQVQDAVKTPHVVVGDGFEEYQEHFSMGFHSKMKRDPRIPDDPVPESFANLLKDVSALPRPLDWKAVQALYIRASGAEEKLRESHGKPRT